MRTFSSGEVAQMCDVTSRTVMRWIVAGRLKAFKLPGRGNNRVHEEDLLSFLSQNSIPVPEELLEQEEQNCLIVSSDKHVLRHAKRIVRDADFVVKHLENSLQVGFAIAKDEPNLIIVDSDTVDINITELISQFQQIEDYKPVIFTISEYDTNNTCELYSGELRAFHKPLDIHSFSYTVDNIFLAEM